MKTFASKFMAAAPHASAFPKPRLPEVAVVGRSNSGKSSLINALVGQRGLARVSRQPGRTRAIHFYEVEDRFLLVDLPGYGYAAAPKTEQASWQSLVRSYLDDMRPLRGVMALFDIRRQPDDLDSALIGLLGGYRLACQVVWTKADKLKPSQLKRRVSKLDSRLSTWPAGIVFSSKSRLGRDALIEWVERQVMS